VHNGLICQRTKNANILTSTTRTCKFTGLRLRNTTREIRVKDQFLERRDSSKRRNKSRMNFQDSSWGKTKQVKCRQFFSTEFDYFEYLQIIYL
jgi:ABC-type antimicrobial peptide transport system ATPase subunit